MFRSIKVDKKYPANKNIKTTFFKYVHCELFGCFMHLFGFVEGLATLFYAWLPRQFSLIMNQTEETVGIYCSSCYSREHTYFKGIGMRCSRKYPYPLPRRVF